MPQTAMLVIPLVMAAASAATGIMAGQAQKQQAEQQAQMQRIAAQNARTEASLKAEDIGVKANRLAGKQAALAGVGGVDISGSVVDNLADTKAGAAKDIFNVNWSADAKADLLEANAANVEQQGQQALTSSYIGAGIGMAKAIGGAFMGGMGGGSGITGAQEISRAGAGAFADPNWLTKNPSMTQNAV